MIITFELLTGKAVFETIYEKITLWYTSCNITRSFPSKIDLDPIEQRRHFYLLFSFVGETCVRI